MVGPKAGGARACRAVGLAEAAPERPKGIRGGNWRSVGRWFSSDLEPRVYHTPQLGNLLGVACSVCGENLALREYVLAFPEPAFAKPTARQALALPVFRQRSRRGVFFGGILVLLYSFTPSL